MELKEIKEAMKKVLGKELIILDGIERYYSIGIVNISSAPIILDGIERVTVQEQWALKFATIILDGIESKELSYFLTNSSRYG